MRCSNCGWDNPDNLTHCEKCNTPLAAQSGRDSVNQFAVQPEVQNPQQKICGTIREDAIFPANPITPQIPVSHPQSPITPQSQRVKANAAPVGGTVNPWIQVVSTNRCCLDPVPQDGVETPETLLLKGNQHTLNRANLDPENQTITSQTQACLTCEEGQWYIEDQSSQHTTFIYAGEKTALKDGDVILMGNRQFIFHIN